MGEYLCMRRLKIVTRLRELPRPERIQAILEAYRVSQLTQREFCEQHGIGLSTLTLWRRKHGKVPALAQEPEFICAPNLFASRAGPAAYRFESPRAMTLEVRSGFDLEELAAVLKVLQSL
jgi:transposase-like protein